MNRFNFVMHGMVACVEDGEMVDVLVPAIDSHRYVHGEPQVFMGLISLHQGEEFSIDGPQSGGTPMVKLLSPKDVLLLKRSDYDIDRSLAVTRHRVPRPDTVRLFRATEVTQTMRDSIGRQATLGMPELFHDVLVFSYLHVPGNVRIVRTSGSNPGVVREFDGRRLAESWCLYAQPDQAEVHDHPIPGLNRMFISKATGVPAVLDALSHAGLVDGPCSPSSVQGLNTTFCMTLNELKNQGQMAQTGGAGCSKVVAVESW